MTSAHRSARGLVLLLLLLGALTACSEPEPTCVTQNDSLTLCAQTGDAGVTVTTNGLDAFTSADVGWSDGSARVQVPADAGGTLPAEWATVLATQSASNAQVTLRAVQDSGTTNLSVRP